MSRLLASMKLDAQLQLRNSLYQIAIGAGLLIGAALWYFFNQDQLRIAVPLMLLFGSAATGYIFIAALVLFEKQQNTLNGLMVTPLRVSEYVNAKIISLSGIAIVESLCVLGVGYVITYGLALNLAWFFAGVVVLAVVYTLFGLIIVVRYDTINEFLVPTLAFMLIAQLPALAPLGLWDPLFLYLIPTYPPLLLLLTAFSPESVATWQVVYALVGSLVAIGGLYYWAQRAFDKHIVQKVG